MAKKDLKDFFNSIEIMSAYRENWITIRAGARSIIFEVYGFRFVVVIDKHNDKYCVCVTANLETGEEIEAKMEKYDTIVEVFEYIEKYV